MLHRTGAPDFAQQLPVGEHLAGAAGQGTEQAIFDGGEAQVFAVAPHEAAHAVKLDAAEAQRHRWRGLAHGRAAQRGAHPRQQFGHTEGFAEKVIGAQIEGTYLDAFGRAGREHEQRRAAPAAELVDEVDAIAVGQAQIEDDEVGLARGGVDQPARHAVGLADAPALGFERRAHDVADLGLVFDHQDEAGGCGHGTTLRAARNSPRALRASSQRPCGAVMGSARRVQCRVRRRRRAAASRAGAGAR